MPLEEHEIAASLCSSQRRLDRGNPRAGFARIRCPDCHSEHLSTFSFDVGDQKSQAEEFGFSAGQVECAFEIRGRPLSAGSHGEDGVKYVQADAGRTAAT
jgi:hypothetical protein